MSKMTHQLIGILALAFFSVPHVRMTIILMRILLMK